jgi:predicted DCC family thiol-disulfide oxidoreductase YuxK
MSTSAPAPASAPAPYLVLYDGVCGLCNRSVQFILQRDPRGRFHFMPLQSADAAVLLQRHGVPLSYDSFVLIEGPGTPEERLFTKSQAARRVARGLGGLWRVLGLCAGILKPWAADWLYDQVATRRYRWFGKADACLLPSPTERERFLGLGAIDGPVREPDAA